jgi:hypothetical protein
MLAMTVEFLQKAHELKLDFSTRDGINLLRYALKRMQQDADHPAAQDSIWHEALERCLGPEALDLDELARNKSQSLGGQTLPMGFADFFFNPGDSLHPGSELFDDEDSDDGDDDEDEDIPGFGEVDFDPDDDGGPPF